MTREIDNIATRLEHAAESVYNYSPDCSQDATDFLNGDAVWLVERVRTLEQRIDRAIEEAEDINAVEALRYLRGLK